MMIRNLKALGLSLVAILAFSAAAASAASAQNGVLTSDGPMTLKGTQTGAETANSITWFGSVTTCASATYTGHRVTVTPHEKIPNNSSEITVTPTYGTCNVGGATRATVDMNGCDYVLDLTGAIEGDRYNVTTTIVCPTGKHIVWTLFTGETFHKESKAFCHYTITEKTSYGGLVLQDNTNNTLSLTGSIEGVEVDKEAIAGTTTDTGIGCPKETIKNAIFHIDVKFVEASGTAIGLSTKEEPDPRGPEKLTGDGPMTLVGTPTGEEKANSLTAFGQTFTCPGATFSGHKYAVTPHKAIESGATTITITPNYGVCNVGGGLKMTTDMNGCDYVLYLEETTENVDEYSVNWTIQCPTGKHIVTTLFTNSTFHNEGKSFCHVTITESAAAYKELKLKDTTNNSLDLTGTIEGVEADKEAIAETDKDTPTILCPKETTKTGTLHVDLSIKDTGGTAISLSDKEEPDPRGPEKLTGDGPMTLVGTPTGEEKANSLTAFGQTFTCPGATFSGHKYAVTPHKAIESGATTITITPNYGVCNVGGGLKMTTDMNGCDYVLYLEETTENVDEYSVNWTIQCPTGKHIVTTLFTNSTFHNEGKSFCHVTITESAAAYKGLKLKDTTNNSLDLTGTIEGISADKEIIAGTTTETGILCPKETTKTGILHVDLSVKDTNGTAISLSHT